MSNKQWDDLVDPARVALEALITSGDNMTDRIEELEAKLAKAMDALDAIKLYSFDEDACSKARTTLAELKGEK